MTDYSELLKAGRIRQGRFSRDQVEACLRLAGRDIETAQATLGMALGPEYRDALIGMERMRRQRNRATYDVAGTITRRHAKEAIDAATNLVTEIQHRLTAEA